MKRNILAILLFIGFIIIQWGCDQSRGSCGGYANKNYTIKGIDTTFILSLKETPNASSDSYQQGDTVTFDKFRIHVTLLRELVSYNRMYVDFGTTTIAAPCPDPSSINDWQLDSLQVLQTVNGRETLLDSVAIQNNSYNMTELALDWSEPTNRIMLNNLFKNDDSFSIGMLNAPSVVELQTYRIVFFLSDGQKMEATTSPIILKP